MRGVGWLVVAIGLMIGCGDGSSRVVLEPDERVVGRARDGKRVRLLTTSGRLVTVQLADYSTASETVVGLQEDEAPRGLAVSSNGRWWTLAGTAYLAEIGERGRVATRVRLEGNYVGLFSVGDTILIQPATPAPGTPVLQGLELATMRRWNVGALRASSFDTRAEALAFNLVACGSGSATELPCWFSHGLRVGRVASTGKGRQQVLSGLGLAADAGQGLEQLETPGPIIDAHIDAADRLWVLVRRSTRAGGKEAVVARYSSDDELEALVTVSGRSRLILDVRGADCVLLVGAGQFLRINIP